MALSRNAKRRLLAYPAILGALAVGVAFMTVMPGTSFRGTPKAPSKEALDEREALARDVRVLAEDIGERNLTTPGSMARAADHVEARFVAQGHVVRREPVVAQGGTTHNLVIEVPGTTSKEIVLVGAHYDTCRPAPGADDNASGVAILLALSARFAKPGLARTLRFVAFANEEPPHFWTESMGSLVHARAAALRKDPIVAMLSLESLGVFRGKQKYPPPIHLLYPEEGDFVAFVGDLASRALVRRTVGTFRGAAEIPSEGAALPGFVSGVGWSDHWSFWQVGVPAVMVTDTAVFRNPSYHLLSDTPDAVDAGAMQRVTHGLDAVLRDLASR